LAKISQSQAAKLAGVSRQAINSIKKKGTLNFFCNDNGKMKINTDSADWKDFISDKGVQVSGQGRADKSSGQKIIDGGGGDPGGKKSGGKIQGEESETPRQKYALTGGYNVDDMFYPSSIQQLKQYTEIRKLEIEMRVRLGNLVEAELVEKILQAIGQKIQSHFVDLPRRVSEAVCRKLDCVGMEKEVEKIISDPVARGIAEVKKAAEKSLNLKIEKRRSQDD
jgi:hypothetical protein